MAAAAKSAPIPAAKPSALTAAVHAMTRRDFAAFLGMLSVAMIGNLDRMDGDVRTKASGGRGQHIRSRRLFNFAAGTIAVAEWEREHLHECIVCQTMGFVFIRSISRFPDLEFKDVRN
jgi:hypothetical protein